MAVIDTLGAPSWSEQKRDVASSPLEQLRMSPREDVLPRSRRSDPRSHKSYVDKQYNKILQPKKRSGAGFDLDAAVPHSQFGSSSTPAHGHADQPRIATVLLSSNKLYKNKFNILDTLPSKESSPDGQADITVPKISPALRNRAEVVRNTLGLKYFWIQRLAESQVSDHGSQSPVFSSYNPLQLLRNRQVRSRLDHPPPPAPQTPLPCDAFSGHLRHGRRPWKMFWGIDINEVAADYAWSKVHWMELINARGDYWFPEAANQRQSSKSKHLSTRLHDKLWNDTENEKLNEDNLVSQISFSGHSKENRKGLKNNLKQRARRLYGSSTSSNSDSEHTSTSNHSYSKSTEGISKIKFLHSSRSHSESELNQFYEFKMGSNGEIISESNLSNSNVSVSEIQENNGDGNLQNISDGNFMNAPQIIVGDVDGSETAIEEGKEISLDKQDFKQEDFESKIKSINFQPAHSRNPSTHKSDMSTSYSPSSNEEAGLPDNNFADITQLQSIGEIMERLKANTLLSANFLESVYPSLIESTGKKLAKINSHDLVQLTRSVGRINNDLLPLSEKVHKGYTEEAKSIIHMANDECAVKIDNLLSMTDRSYGELNTSLLMELRKTNERLNRVNRSLFGNVMEDGLASGDALQILEVTDRKFLYTCLENMIIVVLRLIWITVNILKVFLMFFKFIWRIVKIFIPFIT